MVTDNNNNESFVPEVVSNNSLETIIRTELDVQIETAKKYPRDLTRFMKRLEGISTMTQEIAESCNYALPRKFKDEQGNWQKKILQGPSVRFAEIANSVYGNTRAGARVIANDGRTITAQGVFHDLETNVFVSVEVRRSILNRTGQPFSEEMQVVTGNAACAIAFRNVVFKGIPAATIQPIYEKVLEVAKGTSDTLEKRRNAAIDFFVKRNITKEQIFDALQVTSENEIDLDKLLILSGMKASLSSGEHTITDLFTPEVAKKFREKAKAASDQTAEMVGEITPKKEKKK